MKIIESCEQCLMEKQEIIATHIEDPAIREEFLTEVKSILYSRQENDSAPLVVSRFRALQPKYNLAATVFPKEKYNNLILSFEEQIEERINASDDPLATSILFARVGNYIDFGAMNVVDDNLLLKLIAEAEKAPIDADVYSEFLLDCEKATNFLILCDNCGEIVFDKLVIRQLKKRFPNLSITAMVRGLDVLNDATLSDANQVGLDKEVPIITNGTAVAGTIYEMLPADAKAVFDNADVILSKGQGNYETLVGINKNIYYTFLCKCDLFTNRFNVPKLTGMFVK